MDMCQNYRKTLKRKKDTNKKESKKDKTDGANNKQQSLLKLIHINTELPKMWLNRQKNKFTKCYETFKNNIN